MSALPLLTRIFTSLELIALASASMQSPSIRNIYEVYTNYYEIIQMLDTLILDNRGCIFSMYTTKRKLKSKCSLTIVGFNFLFCKQ